MSKQHQAKVTVGTDIASVLLAAGCMIFVGIFHLLTLVVHPKQQLSRALGATTRGLLRLGRYLACSYKDSRLARSMRELLADSS